MTEPRIVVVGGGAGGLELATRLGEKLGKRKRADVVLVDRNSTHIWKPLLHEIATGALDSGLDEVSYQGHSKHHGYRFQRGSLSAIDREARTITLEPIHDSDGEVVLPARQIEYDYLVLSVGSVSNDFGTPGVAERCHFIDSPQQAEHFRRHMLDTFLRYSDPERRTHAKLSVGLVGAGATGVELAAELFGASRMLHSYGFTALDSTNLEVHLIEAAPRILPALPERISRAVHGELERLGVKIHVDTRITEANEDGFITADGTSLHTDLSVWAAGIRAPAFLSELGITTERNHQVTVSSTLQSVDDERIFAFGDCAACPLSPDDDNRVPPRAQAANQQASLCYRNLRAAMENKPLKPFTYRDRGSLISLAHFDAVGSLMRGTSARSLFIEGRLARMFYASLYRMHQMAIHGAFRTGMTMLVDRLNRYLRPKMKLH
ncbi:NAD(P)/FAD-dependent oxidoreductase [Salinicola halophilus]|uniref:NAD(P)/FAD-dependent oxidoreductase n=1 Tax=Salinicola halophilus TaxID=184065 RepID=UPI000DA1DA50|nr:NAD(P)/FAD-dependent oxidoreductase [Salinicola halophilus]